MQSTEEALVFDNIPLTFDLERFHRDVRLDAYPELAKELERYLNYAGEVVRPRALLRIAYVQDRGDGEVTFGGRRFSSEILAYNVKEIHRVFAYTASCGPELYSLDLSAFDPLAVFWHDTFKTRALDAASTFLHEQVKEIYGISQLSSMNPGSGDAEVWPNRQQRELFAVLGDTESLIGVRLTESSLMVPDKSVSGIYFPSEKGYVNCQSCTREICPTRCAEYVPWDE